MPVISGLSDLTGGPSIESMVDENVRIDRAKHKIVGRYMSDQDRVLGHLSGSSRTSLDNDNGQDIAVSKILGGEIRAQQSKVKQEEQEFLEAMKEYELEVKQKYKTNIQFTEKHTMAEVWTEIDVEVNRYENPDQEAGIWGKVRLAFRSLGEHGKAIEEWLGLVPSDPGYLSTLCGGIKFMLRAATRMKDLRDEILKWLHNIPVLLNGSQRVLGVYSWSQELQGLSDALYTATITGLGRMLGYIRRRAISKVIPVVLKGSSFQRELSECLESIQKCRDDSNEEATRCHAIMQKSIFNELERNNGDLGEIKTRLSQMDEHQALGLAEQKRTSQFIKDQILLIYDNTTLLKEDTRALKQDNAELKEDIHRVEEQGKDKGSLLSMVHDFLIGNNTLHSQALAENNLITNFVLSPTGGTHTGRSYSQDDLYRKILKQLNYDPKQTQKDLGLNHALAGRLTLEDQDRCVWIMNSPKLATWIKSTSSSLLIVNGNMTQTQPRNPLSVVASRLIVTLDLLRWSNPINISQITPVYFFCGKHVDRADPLNNVASILNSLLGQVLLAFQDIDLMKLINLGKFKSDDQEAVWKRFKLVLRLLPQSSIVFCIIDNLPAYLSGQTTAEDARTLLVWLIKLTRRTQRSNKGCIFKVLLTAPLRFIDAGVASLEDDEKLNVPRVVPSTGGFTETKWSKGAGKQVADLGAAVW